MPPPVFKGNARSLVSVSDRAALINSDSEDHIITTNPIPLVSMITINRPLQGNTMTMATRAQLFNRLQLNDQDPDVRVTIIRGAEHNFGTGYEQVHGEPTPFFEAEGDGNTARSNLNSFFMLNDLAKPVVAMVEGNCLDGSADLAAACDVVIAAEDAKIGASEVRGQGLSDYGIAPWLMGMRGAMESMLLNRPMTGKEAVDKGWATLCVPTGENVEEATLEFAKRVIKIPSDLLAFNKRSVHRAFEAQGMRDNLRNNVDLETLMFHAPGAKILTARRAARKGGKAPPRPKAAAAAAKKAPPKRRAEAAVAHAPVSSSSSNGKRPAVVAPKQARAGKTNVATSGSGSGSGDGIHIHLHDAVNIHVNSKL